MLALSPGADGEASTLLSAEWRGGVCVAVWAAGALKPSRSRGQGASTQRQPGFSPFGSSLTASF